MFVSFAVTLLTNPVKKIADELNACLALVFRFNCTNLVKIILGADVYPVPGSVILIPVIAPWNILASAFAPIPPPPVMRINGGS